MADGSWPFPGTELCMHVLYFCIKPFPICQLWSYYSTNYSYCFLMLKSTKLRKSALSSRKLYIAKLSESFSTSSIKMVLFVQTSNNTNFYWNCPLQFIFNYFSQALIPKKHKTNQIQGIKPSLKQLQPPVITTNTGRRKKKTSRTNWNELCRYNPLETLHRLKRPSAEYPIQYTARESTSRHCIFREIAASTKEYRLAELLAYSNGERKRKRRLRSLA